MIIVLEQKQIEEMSEDIARMLCEIYRPNCDEYEPHTCSKCYVNSTPIGCFVEILYNAGYCKQRECKWIVCGMFDDFLKCSSCGYQQPWKTAIEYNYCPNCGAKMKGGAE